jgi:hypothetical protein
MFCSHGRNLTKIFCKRKTRACFQRQTNSSKRIWDVFLPTLAHQGLSVAALWQNANLALIQWHGRYGIYALSGDAIVGWYTKDESVPTDLKIVRQEIMEFL